MSEIPCTLHKRERICSKKLIDALFQGGHSHSISAFPLRLVYMDMTGNHRDEQCAGADCQAMTTEKPLQEAGPMFMVSVPKRCFKRAVHRNRAKRQVREAYRCHKFIVADHAVAMAFIWLDSHPHETADVEARMVTLLHRLNEKLNNAGKK